MAGVKFTRVVLRSGELGERMCAKERGAEIQTTPMLNWACLRLTHIKYWVKYILWIIGKCKLTVIVAAMAIMPICNLT